MTRLRHRLRRCLAAPLLAAASASAQPVIQTPAEPLIQTPAEEYELPEPRLGEPPPAEVLPPIPPLPPEAPRVPGARVFVRAFRFEGNTAFDDAELARVTAPWSGREIASDELRAARDAVTRHYIEAGYVSSGAVLPDQEVAEGVVTIQVVEGRLAAVEVEGARWFRPSYFASRILASAGVPLRVQDVERRLEIFQQDPRLSHIAARLEPTEQRGETRLRLRVEEALPVTFGLEWSNDVPPSLGEQAGRVDASLSNLIGVGDELSGDVRVAEGLVDTEASYRVPVTPWDTELESHARWSDGKIVEADLQQADFTSGVFTVGFGLLQPLWRSEQDTLRAALIGEWRRSRTEQDGDGFEFPGSGADPQNGQTTVSVLRLGGEWVHRARARVVAVRQLVSFGLHALDATQNPSGTPDGSFVSFLTQIRAAERFDRLLGVELVLRGDLQLSTEPLVPMEQIGVGGVSSVRGYRENELVRDQAATGGVELRVPVFRDAERGHVVQLAPFFDAGYGWSASGRDDDPSTSGHQSPESKSLFGVGVGLRYRYRGWLGAELYWGDSLSSVPKPPSQTLQDDGIYFRVGVDLP